MLIKYPKLLHDVIPELGQVVGVALHQVAAVSPLRPIVMSVTTVDVRGKILTITGDTGWEHLVLEAGEVLDKHFNTENLHNKAALLGPGTPSPALAAVAESENSSQVGEVASNDGCAVAELMETQEEVALPAQVVTSSALVSAADTGAEVTEACANGECVVEAALASAGREQMEAAAGAKDTVVEEASNSGESVELPGLVLASVEAEDMEAAVGAEDTVTETVSERSYACKQCGKTFDSPKKRDNHKYNLHNTKPCSLCGKEIKSSNFKRHQARCRGDGSSTVMPEQAVLGCTGLYWAVLGCTGLYWAVLGCTGL